MAWGAFSTTGTRSAPNQRKRRPLDRNKSLLNAFAIGHQALESLERVFIAIGCAEQKCMQLMVFHALTVAALRQSVKSA